MARRKKIESEENITPAKAETTSATEEIQAESEEQASKSAPTKDTKRKKKAQDDLPPIDQSLLLIPIGDEGQKERKIEKKTPNGSEKPAARSKNLPTISGTRQVQKSTVPLDFPAIEKKNLAKTLLLLLIFAAVIVASVLIFVFRPSDYDERTHSVNFFYAPEREVTVIAVDGRTRGEVSGEVSHYAYNGSGKICAAIVGGDLYVIEGKQIEKVAVGVQDFVLSANGKVLAWRSTENVLYYDTLKDKNSPSPITTTATVPHYALSPDGKEMFYTYAATDTALLYAGIYSCTDSAPYIQSPTGIYPIAVANKCKYLYYTDDSGALYMMIGKTGEKIPCGKEPELSSIIFNRDYSQLIFRNGTETRIFAKGEQIRLPGISSTDHLLFMPNQRAAIRPLRVGAQYLVDDFFDQYYLLYTGSGIKLVYLEKKKSQAIIGDVSYVDGPETVTVTDKAVFFLSTSKEESTSRTKLFRCPNGKIAEEQLAWDVTAFCANVDGSRILYTDVQGALYSRKIGSTSQRLCDSIVIESLCVTAQDAFYFYQSEGVLMVSDNGEAPRLIQEDVGEFFVDAQTLYYATGQDESGVGTVYAVHRNRRKVREIAQHVIGMS